MRKRKVMKTFIGMLSAATMLISMMPTTVAAEDVRGEWREENGNMYWYENGVKQGTEGRGKEIYDPGTDAWYWLDSVDDGKMAVSKDVYQESYSAYPDREDGTGKWVRYDENGHMVKGWQTTDAGTYYFETITGAMAKGAVTIDGIPCAFDWTTGVGIDCQWYEIDGVKYWYEGGVRQGLEGRGKEIYDPASDAWYWLDSVDNGKMATSKDVYQESSGGKWVRYDAEGHMIKGWDEKDGNRYYFDPITGAMAKGVVTVDGTTYYFNQDTGICEGEYQNTARYTWILDKEVDKDANGDESSAYVYEHNAAGKTTKYTCYSYGEFSSESTYTYDGEGRKIETTYRSSNSASSSRIEYGENGLRSKETDYDANGVATGYTTYSYDGENLTLRENHSADGTVTSYAKYYYDGDNCTRYEYYYDGRLSSYTDYTYDEHGNETEYTSYYVNIYSGETTQSTHTVYTYIEYNGYYFMESYMNYDISGEVAYGVRYEYDGNTMTKRYDLTTGGAVESYTVYDTTRPSASAGATYVEIDKIYDAEGNQIGSNEYYYSTIAR